MRKILLLIMVGLLLCTMVACANGQEPVDTSTKTESNNNIDSENQEIKSDMPKILYSNMIDVKTIMESHENYIIIDVRTFEEYCDGHIPGAINIPNENIVDVPPERLANKDQLILIYCRSGNRSKQAATKLANMGYTNLVEFGGIIDWDGDIVTGAEPYNL